MFDNLQDQLQEVFDDLKGKGRLTEGDISAAMRRVRMALLEADVSFKVVKSFVTKATARCMEEPSGTHSAKCASGCCLL